MCKHSTDDIYTVHQSITYTDILKTLGLFSYNRKGNPESVHKAEEAEIIKQDTLSSSKGIKIRKKNKYISEYATNKICKCNKSSMENSYCTTSTNYIT